MDPIGATLPRLARPEPGRRARPARRRVLRAAALGALAAGAIARSVRRVVVTGGSMAPALLEGDRLVVAVRWGLPRVTPGDVVAVRDPRDPERLLVKRVSTVDRRRGTVEVLGDAAEASTDSRTFGPVPVGAVVGRVAYRYGPAGRSGPVARTREYHRG